MDSDKLEYKARLAAAVE
jgi:hypothetical protein